MSKYTRQYEECGRKRHNDYSDCDKKYDAADSDDAASAHGQCIEEANRRFDECVGSIPNQYHFEITDLLTPTNIALFMAAWGVAALVRRKVLIFI